MEWNRLINLLKADYVIFSDSIAERAPNTGYISVQIVWEKGATMMNYMMRF
jgi:hypothetical protein